MNRRNYNESYITLLSYCLLLLDNMFALVVSRKIEDKKNDKTVCYSCCLFYLSANVYFVSLNSLNENKISKRDNIYFYNFLICSIKYHEIFTFYSY
jgi:hypothetical protein